MTASDDGGRGGLGWVILALALAVPGVLFYQWWTHLKAERERTVAAKARGRLPEGQVFEPASGATRLVNPMTSAPSTSAVVAAGTVPAIAAVLSAAAASSETAPGDEAASSQAVAHVADAVAVSTLAAQVLARDPMLSPFDLVRQQEEELKRRLAEQKLRDEREGRRKTALKREPPPETLVEVQGIIESLDGENRAIVNNEVVGVGDVVGRARVTRITAAGVIFVDRTGRRFIKTVNRD